MTCPARALRTIASVVRWRACSRSSSSAKAVRRSMTCPWAVKGALPIVQVEEHPHACRHDLLQRVSRSIASRPSRDSSDMISTWNGGRGFSAFIRRRALAACVNSAPLIPSSMKTDESSTVQPLRAAYCRAWSICRVTDRFRWQRRTGPCSFSRRWLHSPPPSPRSCGLPLPRRLRNLLSPTEPACSVILHVELLKACGMVLLASVGGKEPAASTTLPRRVAVPPSRSASCQLISSDQGAKAKRHAARRMSQTRGTSRRFGSNSAAMMRRLRAS